MRYRHKKTGGYYEVIAEGKVQTKTPLQDYDQVIIYKGEDGKVWVRPESEFRDGRFEREVIETPLFHHTV